MPSLLERSLPILSSESLPTCQTKKDQKITSESVRQYRRAKSPDKPKSTYPSPETAKMLAKKLELKNSIN
jgi:hypothetical protein